MVNIVTIAGQRYHVDVGYGAGGAPVKPLPLVHGLVSANVGRRSVRLVRAAIPQQRNCSRRLWCLEHRDSDEQPWVPTYCFTEVEFLPEGFEIMNYWTGTSKRIWSTSVAVCVEYIVEDDEVVGGVLLFERDVKRRIGGESEVLERVANEEQRVAALEKCLGVKLSRQEREGILGMVSNIGQGRYSVRRLPRSMTQRMKHVAF
jgi:arylamine N-acetyltransferase